MTTESKESYDLAELIKEGDLFIKEAMMGGGLMNQFESHESVKAMRTVPG